MTTPVPRPETIDRLASAVYPSFAMLAGMQLDLFTPLKDGPMSARQIADALGVRANKLQPLLYALVTAGLLVLEGERFANTSEADRFLVRGKPTYQGGGHGTLARWWNAILKTAESVRAGEPQARIDYSAMPESALDSYCRTFSTPTTAAARDLMSRYDFSTCRRLLDVGGGAGYLSIAATEDFSDLQATVVDLPTVTPIAERVVVEAGVADRVRVMTADVVNDSLQGSYDVAVMCNFIQVLSAEQARRAINNVGQVIKPGGTLYVVGQVIDNSRMSPLEAVGMNLYFLNVFDQGQAHTEQEHRDWLAEAGFVEGFQRVALPDGSSIIRARKPG